MQQQQHQKIDPYKSKCINDRDETLVTVQLYAPSQNRFSAPSL